ncbi:DUF2231 domain-containing protein [Georgenia thermotolerans]|uniref:DUF2231 domain-containing protein n=1 Tax=Georgenia thermotolerans TaxID=527326 RepID=A0A7J5ULC8_9MICO|nr:DUF2231 domain-containing protein [Georgenia thermotolerans]KAE8763178.1 DUF2231 domain-containing protein [Georgenia thermotolerans]
MGTDRTSPLAGITRGIEDNRKLDAAVRALKPVADGLVANPSVRDLLHGHWLGHALHPLLTDLPLGMWMSSMALDLTGGPAARPASSRLLGLGVLAAVPTAVTGLAEWAVADTRSQRVGITHATANSVALTCFAASWVARRAGRHDQGVALSLAGGLVSVWGGYLGGHLTLARKVGTFDPATAGDGDTSVTVPSDGAAPVTASGAGIETGVS